MRTLLVLLLSSLVALWVAPAMAEPALEATLTLSDGRPGIQGVIYSWDLEVSASVEASSIRVTLARGTAGTPTLYLVDGLPKGSLRTGGDVIEYNFDRVQLAAGHKIIFAVGGVTNPSEDGGFSSQVAIGGLDAKTPPVSFDSRAASRAMVFVTAAAARLSREDPSPVRLSSPVLMTNEQEPVYSSGIEMTSPRSAASTGALAASLIASMLMLIVRRNLQLASA